jgi:copper(I)-binding protein
MTHRWTIAGAGLIVALAIASCSSTTETATATESATPTASPTAEVALATETATATATPTPAPTGPTVMVLDQHCNSGKLIVVVGANADSSYRKGISSVVMERQNEYDAWLDFNATWMGPETGSGNQWTATITHLAGDTVRITATATSHSTKTITAAITASC